MLKQILHKALRARHYWRQASFSELNEIYIAMLVRGISLSMMGLFVPIFMYKLGYSVTLILLLMTIYFVARTFCDVASAYLVAYLGPKHVMFIGQVIFAISSALFLTLPTFHWPLWLLGSVWGASQSCFFMAFDVDFSKIKHTKHGGEELGYAEIMGKVGAFLGPIIGGVIALLFGARYIFAISTVLLLLGLMPLFKTREPVKTRQQLNFNSFPLVKNLKFLPSIVALHVENTISVMLWPLFLAIFAVSDQDVYLKVGIISATSMIFAVISSRTVGELIDSGRGRATLRVSAIGNALLHLVRPLVRTFYMAVPLDISNQVVTAGYRLPFLKAHYDHADDLPGYRIVYVCVSECISSFIKAVVYLSLVVISMTHSDHTTFSLAFAIAAVASVIIATEIFPSLRPPRKSKPKRA